MSILIACLQIILVLASPVLQIMLGRLVYGFVVSRFTFSRDESPDLEAPTALVLGLLLHLTAIFFLKSIGLWWPAAFFLPLLLLVLGKGRFKSLLCGFKIQPSLNFLIWFFVVICLGVSLFQSVDGIQTPWVNNYGDLAFHLGMITSFVFGGNFPPEYHLFAGQRLSYPFYVNLWSASLWWPGSGFRMLAFIFTFQWVVLWNLVYYFLRGNRFWLLPWALLLGGGSYLAFDTYSWEVLSKGYPWTVFLTTLWVTQRAALFGAVCALGALWSFFSWYETCDFRRPYEMHSRLVLAGLILALAPLAHTHIWLVTVLFISGLLLCRILISLWAVRTSGVAALCPGLIYLGTFWLVLLPGIVFLPWLLGKAGVASLIYGWSVSYDSNRPHLENLAKSAWTWATNAPVWLALFAVFWLATLRHVECLVLAALFLVGNFVNLSYWDWDQIKFFLAVYLLFLLVWSRSKDAPAFRLHHLCLLLVIPALVESYKIFNKGELHTVYSKEVVALAEKVRAATPPQAVIAAAPDHNTVITLTGRRLFMGYTGTLWSHGIDPGEREGVSKDGVKLCAWVKDKCGAEVAGGVCPGYLLWTDAEKRYMGSLPPCAKAAGEGVVFELR